MQLLKLPSLWCGSKKIQGAAPYEKLVIQLFRIVLFMILLFKTIALQQLITHLKTPYKLVQACRHQ